MSDDDKPRQGTAWRAALYMVPGIVAGAALAHDRSQDATPASGTAAERHSPGPDIVVEGQRDSRRLRGGLWTVKLSKSYHYGAPLDDPWSQKESGRANEQRPAGSEKTWRFCLADVEVEPMMRLLVGEGNSTASGTASCTRLAVKMGSGKISAQQRCSGFTMPRPDPLKAAVGGDIPTAVVDSCGGATGAVVQAISKLSVSGRYDRENLNLEFFDAREPLCFDPRYGSRPYGRRWTISGVRNSDCDRDGHEDGLRDGNIR